MVQSRRSPGDSPKARTIVIGFVGGRVHPDNLLHREVQVARDLQKSFPLDADVAVFANSHGRDAYRTILGLLDENKDGEVSSAEKQAARIVIYGHSWGASEAVALARRLKRDAIPVLLAVQIDGVSKFRNRDGLIPANVEQTLTLLPNGWSIAWPQYHSCGRSPANKDPGKLSAGIQEAVRRPHRVPLVRSHLYASAHRD